MRSILTPQGLQEIIADLQLSGDQLPKFLDFVRGAGMVNERITFAMRLLDLKTPKPVIRDRLMAREGISREHAYRVIRQALDARKTVALK